MGCEIGSIRGRFESKAQVECFIECFNSIMEEKEPWFEEDHVISMDDFDEDCSCELDIWGRFQDTADTALKYVVGALVKQHPSEGFSLAYDRAWDNCGETYYEEYIFGGGSLAVRFWEEDVYFKDDDDDDEDDYDEDDCDEEESDDDDYDGDFVHEIVREQEWVFEYTDGGLKLVSGEPDADIMEAMGIESEE